MNIIRKTLILAAAFALTACGTTVEKQDARYKRAMDALNAVATKNPKMKSSIDAQKKTFEADYKKVMAGSDAEAKKTELARLNGRIEAFTKKIDPDAKKAAANDKKKAAPKTDAKKKTDTPTTGTKAPPAAAVKTDKMGGSAAPSKLGEKPDNTALPANKLGGTPTPKKLGGTPAPTNKLGGSTPPPANKLGGTQPPANKLGGQ